MSKKKLSLLLAFCMLFSIVGVFGMNSQQAPVAEGTFTPVADAYVWDGSQAGNNYGTDTMLITKANQGEGLNRKAYLKFDLTGLSEVNTAVLRIYGKADFITSIRAYKVIKDWDESTITWKNAPYFSSIIGSTAVSPTLAFRDIDVTSYVQSRLSKGAQTITIGIDTDNSATGYFESKEGLNKPQLIVTSSAPIPTPTPAPTPAPVSLTAPEPPQPDSIVRLKKGTQEELEAALAKAKGDGWITKIVMKKDTVVPIDTIMATVDMSDGKKIILDFNGGSLDFNVSTNLKFIDVHKAEEISDVSAITNVGDDTKITCTTAVPQGLKVGDYVKVVSEDRVPGTRSDRRRMGEAMQVKEIDGLDIILRGTLMQQELYTKEIRVSKYNALPEALWLINPVISAELNYTGTMLWLDSLVKPRVISPVLSKNANTLLCLQDCVESIVTDPSVFDGINDSKIGYTYGVLSNAGKDNWVYRTDGSTVDPNGTKIRHVVDASDYTPADKFEIRRYGNDIGLRATGITSYDNLDVPFATHAGSWGALFEGMVARRNGGAAAFTIRGMFHTIKDADVEDCSDGFQMYNERGITAGISSEIGLDEIVVDGGTFKVRDQCIFTSSNKDFPIGTMRTINSPKWESTGSQPLFDIHYQGTLIMSGDIIKVSGTQGYVFNIVEGSTLKAKDITIDLTNYAGPQNSVTLFYAGSDSTVEVENLTVIDPYGKLKDLNEGSGVVTIR